LLPASFNGIFVNAFAFVMIFYLFDKHAEEKDATDGFVMRLSEGRAGLGSSRAGEADLPLSLSKQFFLFSAWHFLAPQTE